MNARAALVENGTAAGNRVAFHCPGCGCAHMVVVGTPNGWGWNGDLARPTFTPSVLVHSHPTLDENDQPATTPQCHSFVTDGQIAYLGDCTHELVGQTVDLPPWAQA